MSSRTRTPRLRLLLGTIALVVGSALVTLLVLEVTFRLAHVSVGTVQINRATVRKSANPRLRFELAFRPPSVMIGVSLRPSRSQPAMRYE